MFGAIKAGIVGVSGLVALVASPAGAAEYIYSYSFGSAAPGATVTGSFAGDGPITKISNIHNITLDINGVPIIGVSAYSYTGYNGPNGPNNTDPSNFPNSGAIVSSNPLANNFIFGTLGLSQYFYIIPWTNGGDNQVAVQAKTLTGYIPTNVYNGDFVPANFKVSAVPESSTWAMMMLGFGMIGFGLRGRRNKNTVRVTYA